MSDMDIDRHLRAKIADLTEECQTLRAAFRDLNEANEKLLDQNFALAAGRCANVVGDEGGTPQCAEIARLRTLVRRATSQLRKWSAWYGNADHAARGQLPLPPAGDVELAEDISAALGPNVGIQRRP